MTPTDKAAIEGLIAAIAKHRELTQAGSPHALTEAAWNAISMRACEATEALQRLLAGETREAVIADAREYEKQHEAAEQSTIKFVKDYIKTLPHTEAVSECLHCSLNYLVSRFIDKHRAFDALLSSPSPHDDAGAVDYEDAAIDICHECGLDDNENNIRDIVNILRKHTSEAPHHG